MFYNETGVEEDSRHNIVAIKEKGRRKVITFLLGNKKTVIYKRKDIRRNFFFKIFNYFFKCFNNGSHIHSGNDWRKGGALTNTNTSIEGGEREAIPGVCGGTLCVVTVKEVNDVGV